MPPLWLYSRSDIWAVQPHRVALHILLAVGDQALRGSDVLRPPAALGDGDAAAGLALVPVEALVGAMVPFAAPEGSMLCQQQAAGIPAAARPLVDLFLARKLYAENNQYICYMEGC